MKIAVASGKGGTGKTFVATNLFNVLSGRDEEVTLVDCDAEAPDDLLFFEAEKRDELEVTHQVPVINKDACTWCGRCSSWCNYNAIFYVPTAKVIEVIENLCHGCGACSFACNSGAITEKPVVLGTVTSFATSGGSPLIESRMRVNEMSPVRVIKAAIRKAGTEGTVILDAPPGTSCPFVQTVDTADYVMLVTEPTPFGLSDLRQSVETLKTMNKKCGVIINRADIGDNGVRNYLDEEQIPLLAEINYDTAIARSYSEGRLITAEDDKIAGLFAGLADKIITEYGTGSNKR
jgi:MinD superfamily P-loop ATPase